MPLVASTLIAFGGKKEWKKAQEYCASKQYEQCVELYKTALQKNKKFATDPVFQNEFKEAKIELYLEKGYAAIDRQDFSEAEKYFDDVLTLDKENRRAQKGIAKVYFEKAKKMAEEKHWTDAIKLYNLVGKYDPDIEIAQYIKTAQNEIQKAEGLKKQAENNLKIGKYETALKLIEQAKGINYDIEGYELFVNECKKGLATNYVTKANNLLKAGQLLEAEKLYNEALQYMPFEEAKKGLVRISLSKTQSYFSKGQNARALLELNETKDRISKLKIQKQDDVILNQFENIKAALIDSISKRTENYVLGINIEKGKSETLNALNKAVLKQKGPYVQLVDPEKLKQLLLQQKLVLAGIMEGKVGKIRGADYLAIVEITGPDVKTEKWTESRNQQYQCGTRKERNPKYDQLQNDIQRFISEISSKQSQLPYYKQQCQELTLRCNNLEAVIRSWKWDEPGCYSFCSMYSVQDPLKAQLCEQRQVICRERDSVCNSARDMCNTARNIESEIHSLERDKSSAETNLRFTPIMIDVPEYCNWNYQVIHFKKIADGSLSWKLIDAGDGVIMDAGVINKTETATDDMIENANPVAGVFSDELYLPSDSSLTSKVLEMISNEYATNLLTTIRKDLAKKRLNGFENLQGLACEERLVDILYLDTEAALPNYCGFSEEEVALLKKAVKGKIEGRQKN